jgi:hypothetical protein
VLCANKKSPDARPGLGANEVSVSATDVTSLRLAFGASSEFARLCPQLARADISPKDADSRFDPELT